MDDLVAGLIKGATGAVVDLVLRWVNTGDPVAFERLSAILPKESILVLNDARSRQAEQLARQAAQG